MSKEKLAIDIQADIKEQLRDLAHSKRESMTATIERLITVEFYKEIGSSKK